MLGLVGIGISARVLCCGRFYVERLVLFVLLGDEASGFDVRFHPLKDFSC